MSEYEDMKEGRLGSGGSRESCATNKSIEGCIMELVNLANTPFEKKAVIEMASMESRFKEELVSIKANLKWIRYIVLASFFVIGVNFLMKLVGGS